MPFNTPGTVEIGCGYMGQATPVDVDGDGRLDLLMNGSRNVVLWTQVSSADGTWSFRREGELTDQKLAAHSTCPAACDFDGDGVTDLVLGVEDGYIYHLANPRSLCARLKRIACLSHVGCGTIFLPLGVK